MRNVLALCALVYLSACGGSGGNRGVETLQLSGRAYRVLEGADNLRVDPQGLKGTGRIIFIDPLPGGASKNKFRFEFTLEDGGSISLEANSKADLAGGLTFHFAREASNLVASIRGPLGVQDISRELAGKIGTVTEKMGISIAVHNDEVPAHMLLSTLAGTSLLEKEGDGPGNGEGELFGVSLSKATLSHVSVERDSEN